MRITMLVVVGVSRPVRSPICRRPVRILEARDLHHQRRNRHRQQAAGRRPPDQSRRHRTRELRDRHRPSWRDRCGRERRRCGRSSARKYAGAGTVRREERDTASCRRAERPDPRQSDRGLLHRVRRRDDGDRRAYREWPALGARFRGHARAQRPIMQRSGDRSGHGDTRRESRRHHHHSAQHGAWLGEYSGSRRLSEFPSVAWCVDGGVCASVDKKIGPAFSVPACARGRACAAPTNPVL